MRGVEWGVPHPFPEKARECASAYGRPTRMFLFVLLLFLICVYLCFICVLCCTIHVHFSLFSISFTNVLLILFP